MAKMNKGLGMGLDALFKVNITEENDNSNLDKPEEERVIAGFTELPIEKVIPNPDQPRKSFSDEAMESLTKSVKSYGIIQPITVSKKGDFYEIVAGERRYRAAKIVGLKKIPVIIKDTSQREKLELSLIENIQRENLNPIEEAIAYSNLIETYGITHEELSERLGKSRAAITNMIRLLNLDPQIQKYLIDGSITPGHARTILSIENKKEHINFAEYIIKNNLSVREAEKLSKNWPIEKKERKSNVVREIELQKTEEILARRLQSKVNIIGTSHKGKIQIEYFSQEELERLLELFNAKII